MVSGFQALDSSVFPASAVQRVQPPLCWLDISVWIAQTKYILVTENVCVYYCLCIDGTFEHFHKAIRA